MPRTVWVLGGRGGGLNQINAKDCMGWLVIDEQGRCIHVQGEMSPPSSHPDLSLRYTGWSRAPHLVHQAAA